jgi:putative PIN family toxin of toxin-antitoxin system
MIKNSPSFKALEYCRTTGSLLFSSETFLEFELVLFRKKFDNYFSEEERIQIIDRVASESSFKSTLSTFSACRDPKDNMFLNIAVDGKASYIITGDKDLLALNPFKNIPIITVAGFLDMFDYPFLLNEPAVAYGKKVKQPTFRKR